MSQSEPIDFMDEPQSLDDYLVFRMDEQLLAVPVGQLHQVIRAAALTPVPDAPPLLMGLLNRSGEMVPVINLHRRLNLPEAPLHKDDRLIILANTHQIGLRVNEVLGVYPLVPEEMQSADNIGIQLASYILGVSQLNERAVILLDAQAMFDEQELNQIEETISAP
jgi:purine-binding chemotaxis protein CheW